MEKLFAVDIETIIRISITTITIYLLVIVAIRLFGKRSTSKMNNFDWIVTVAAGSIVAAIILNKSISIPHGGLSIIVLLGMQYVVTKIMFKSPKVREVVKSTPQLLLYEGEFIDENMQKERILKAEVYAAIRMQGHKSIKQIYAVVLETNAQFSIIPNESDEEIGFSLTDVQGLPEGLKDDLEQRNDAHEE